MIGIPLPDADAAYTLRIVLDGSEFFLRVEWNGRESFWYLGLSDADEVVIYHPRKVVADWDLLRTCTDRRRPKGRLFAVDTTGEGRDPGFGELGPGKRVELVYVP